MKKIAVIGLGLIGTSLLKALQGKGYELVGISQNPETIKKALDQKLVSEASVDFALLKDADIVFIATPIDTVCAIIDTVTTTVTQEAIVADLASVKGFILDYVNQNTSLNFIGLHPMAGTENKGFDSAEDRLFENSKWAVVPSDFAKRESIELIENLIREIGAKPMRTDAKSHDKAVAIVSHLPMLLSQALFVSASDDTSKTLAASGFRDMTRLAMSNSDMARDMVKFNKENIQEALNTVDFAVKKLLENYQSEDIESIAKQRREMYSKDGKNKF